MSLEHRRALGQLAEAHFGRVVDTDGDGITAAFRSATDALRAAMAMQQRAGLGASGLRLRAGVAAGDVSWQDGHCSGLPVATAARLRSHAGAGQVLATDLVRQLAGDRVGARFRSLGPLDLAGLDDAVDAFEVEWSPTGGRAGAGEGLAVPCPAAVTAAQPFAFVGREAERATLDEVWAEACAGQAHTALVGAEAGAGKTRLALEFARHCASEGATVLLGVCDVELALPYQPWVQVLDHLVAALPPGMVAELGSELAELSLLLPHIDRLAPGLYRTPAPDPETERYRLFTAVETVLAAAARRAPMLIVIDDLHWAGAQTLALLRHLSRSDRPSPLLVVGTFRDTGDEVTEPLASCLADLRRTPRTLRLRLAGLDGDHVARFIASAVGHDLDPALRGLGATLAVRSGGNAFYLGEMWRHLVARGVVAREGERWSVRPFAAGVPDSLREVVGGRLTRLSPVGRRLAELAAVAGQRVELQVLLLAAAPGPRQTSAEVLEDAALGRGLDELVEANLLREEGGALPTYEFVHAIVRDTIEQTIATSARARLHLQLAEAIERVHEADRRPVLARLARHFAAAAALAGPDKAVHYGRQAAEQALRSTAHDEAIRHLTGALELGPAVADRVELRLALGEAMVQSRLDAEAMEVYAEAFRTAADHGLVTQAAVAAAGFAQGVHASGGSVQRAVDVVSESLALLGDEDLALRTKLQAILARALLLAGRGEEGVPLGERALAVARRLGRPDVLAAALQSSVIYSTDPERIVAESRELAHLAYQRGDGWVRCYALGNEIRALIALGRLDEARTAWREQAAAAERGNFVLHRYMALVLDAAFALLEGRFAAAEALAGQAHEFGAAARTEFDAGVYGVQMHTLRREQGRIHELVPVLRLALAVGDGRAMWRPGLAALLAEAGMLEEARRELDLLAADSFAAVPRDAMWPGCLAYLAETCVAVGAVERAGALYRELEAFRGLNLMAGFTVCLGPADRLAGSLAAMLGRHEDAEAHFSAALALAERCGAPPWTARVQHDWAFALGDRPDLLDAASGTAAELGMAGLVERCRAVPGPASPAGRAQSGSPPGRARLPAPGAGPDGLSGREVDVLRLVAAGLSNRQIGERLFISHNTAANHVRSILAKTASANRAEAAAYAARHGLLEAGNGPLEAPAGQ